jgi:hypothetical protein
MTRISSIGPAFGIMGTVLAMMCCFAWKKANLFSHNRKKHNPQKKIKNVHLHIYPSPYSSPISTINLIDYNYGHNKFFINGNCGISQTAEKPTNEP